MKMIRKIKEAGVVGAGGAGFPTYKKLENKAEVFIINGAECEPLLQKDKEMLKNYCTEIRKGFETSLSLINAETGFLAIKEKYKDAIPTLDQYCSSNETKLLFLKDYYPAGDEYEIVYLATGRLIPPGGIPIQVGCVVNNVETVYNVSRALDGIPVTEKFLTITGDIENRVTVKAPIGISVRELFDSLSIQISDDSLVIEGGLMMGKPVYDFSKPVTKITGGYIIIPNNTIFGHKLTQKPDAFKRIGKSACDQCTDCTALCPRYLLGYGVEPHRVMRTLGMQSLKTGVHSRYSLLCCECNLCSYYSCPEDLLPGKICAESKKVLFKEGNKEFPESREEVHQMKQYRRVPVEKLMKKLGVYRYNKPAPYTDHQFMPSRVEIPLKQHIGAPAAACVKPGDHVKKNDVIATIPEDALGVFYHSPVNGTVKNVNSSIFIETV